MNTNENKNNNNSNRNSQAKLMQIMSECSGHTCLPHLEQKNRYSWFSFWSHKVHRDFLFNNASFAARITFLFLVAEIDETGCAFSVIPHRSFLRLIKNILYCLMQMLHSHDLFLSKRQTH